MSAYTSGERVPAGRAGLLRSDVRRAAALLQPLSRSMHQRLLATVVSVVWALPAAAQQFQYQPGALPGAARWSEGVELADVDNDGDLDIFFAEGEGFASAGTKRQNILIINQTVEIGPGNYADESVARLGVHVSNAKNVVTGDINGDGYVDALFVNAFNTDTPFLYLNRGAAQPGFFDMVSASSGLGGVYSSAGAQFGDLDDDGDLDLIITDSGPNFLSGPGGKPHLFFNNGEGRFSENAAALGAPTKIAQMDVQLVDFDGDWDLDFFGANRASNAGGNHYLMLNDGAGNFTDQSSLIPPTSTGVYEAEVGDLDGDEDIDLFLVSLSGFQEGAIENRIVPTTTLSFLAGTPLPGSVDDNEIGLLDYDNDADLDSFVGSLGSTERAYRNDGGLSFAQNNVLTAVSDSTLDLAIGDIDNDGAYDVITAQGESNPAQWANKLYLNTGAADDLPPVIVAVDCPAAVGGWPIVAHAKVRDQVIDDGVNYVAAEAAYVPVQVATEPVEYVGGAFVPAATSVPAGTRVVFTNNDAAAQTVTSLTDPWAYDLPLPGSGGTTQYLFVSPGVYQYRSMVSGAIGTITVTGAAHQVNGFAMGGAQYRFELPQIPPTPSGSIAVELFFRDWPGNESVSESCEIVYPRSLGTVYCDPAVPNSTGVPGIMVVSGSSVVSDDDLTLTALQLPPENNIGYFIMGTGMNTFTPPGSIGPICVAPGLKRYLPPVNMTTELGGGFSRVVGTSGPISGQITPLSTWNFQAWHRDSMAGTSNLTNAVSVNFQ